MNSREDQLLRALAAAPRPDADALLARALPALAAAFEGSGVAVHAQPAPGDVIDERYRIEEILGSGGMGIVFAARHTSTDRASALKWIASHGPYLSLSERNAALRRFRREARAVGRIRHPNVVEVYDTGSDPNSPYLVMEKLEGETLHACMKRGPLPWSEALALIVPTMRGVMAAHAQGVVHRDLKPDNIFLARSRGGQVVPKVLDFGLSGLRIPEPMEGSLTRVGTLLGTPAYMALEQLRGERGVDVRSDVYALGVILYEMLSGARPYRARDPEALAELIASQPPVSLAKRCPELHDECVAAVMKALARDPADRHANVEAFIEALTTARQTSTLQPWHVMLVASALTLAVGLLLLKQFEAAPARERATRHAVVTPATDGAAAPVVEKAGPPPPPRAAAVDKPAQHKPSARPPRAAVMPLIAEPTPTPTLAPAPIRLDELRADFGADSARPATADIAPALPPSSPRLELGRDQF